MLPPGDRDKKIRQGRPVKWWRDDLDKYWSDTIWQRTAHDRLTWKRHAEAFAHPRSHYGCLSMMMMNLNRLIKFAKQPFLLRIFKLCQEIYIHQLFTKCLSVIRCNLLTISLVPDSVCWKAYVGLHYTITCFASGLSIPSF